MAKGKGRGRKGENQGPINADRLKSFVERIERLEEERKAIGGDIRDVYAEAKGVGYDVKTMRKVVQMRGMDAADRAEQETLLETYLHALGMTMGAAVREVMDGAGVRETAAKHGVSRSALSRSVPKADAARDLGTAKPDVISPPEVAALPLHDRETGEITESTAGLEQGASGSSLTPDDAPHEERTDEPPSTPAVAARAAAGTPSLYQRITGAFHDPTRESPENMVALDPKPAPKPPTVDTRSFDEVAGEMPDRLRRVPA
jgi:uncharacterized protein (UPF0335 family)